MNCHQHDYIEIVCLYRYPVKLTLKNTEVIAGVALDTVRNLAKQECIKVEVNGSDCLVVLDTLAILDVTVDNPHFTRVSFDA
ncbi:MAG: Rho-binding antiterminator [Shewanella sp.]